MSAGWAARSITLASLAIRVVVTGQAAGATSMLAALALSRFEVPLSYSAAISMMRFETTGPHKLALIYMSKLLRGKNINLGLTALCLTGTTLLLQFASTVLLSDLKLGTITAADQTTSMPYGIRNNYNGNNETEPLENSAHYWSTKPAVYPALAEYTEPTPKVEDGVYDTGMSIRALLPIYPETNRDRLKNYQGYGNLVDTRVVCMRPVIADLKLSPPPGAAMPSSIFIRSELDPISSSAEYSYSTSFVNPTVTLNPIYSDVPLPDLYSEIAGDGGPIVSGSLTTNLTARRYFGQTDSGSMAFNCSSAIQGVDNTSHVTTDEWPVVLCMLPMSSGIVSDMDNLDVLNSGVGYLVINTTGSYDYWSNVYISQSGVLDTAFVGTDGEWMVYNVIGTDLTMSFSVCFSAFSAQNAVIEVTSSSNRTEPVLGWEPLTSEYDTLSVRQHLGATNPTQTSTTDDRSVLQLTPLANWTVPTTPGMAPTWETFPVDLANEQWYDQNNYTMVLCGHCRPSKAMGGIDIVGQGDFADPAQAAVFNDILKATRHPALAIQAQFTTLFGMAYYDHTFQFDVSTNATTTSFTDILVPMQWTGLYAVATVLVVHLCLVLAVGVWFRARVKESLLGNAWMAVAQLQSEEARSWLEEGNMVSDRELVRKTKKGPGGGNGLVGLKRMDGKVKLAAKGD
ncbi:hypothetical protein MMC17_003695 [Xylographa soralifera]|nr:hypothetical protein [Xylographa soralifera]